MKSKILLFGLLFLFGVLKAQKPILYIQLVSHNEPTDNLDASPLKYNAAKTNALQMADLVVQKKVKWNLQTSDGFVIGALNFESNPLISNFFKTIASPPYHDYIEIDPRSKNKDGRNIADQWYLLDSLGANPSYSVGGCIYSTTDANKSPIDWEKYKDTLPGDIYPIKWKAKFITGAGSYPPHQDDLNDFGIFKPNTATDFYTHNAETKLWCLGTGCAPLLEATTNEQEIIDLIQGQVDSIQNGLWPSDKFYMTRIMTNQSDYSPEFFTKLTTILDSLSLIDSTKLKWATFSETFAAFEQWQIEKNTDYSQWSCGQVSTGINSAESTAEFAVYPNPFSDFVTIKFRVEKLLNIQLLDVFGRIILEQSVNSNVSLDLSSLPTGIYIVRVGNVQQKLIKE